MVLYKIVDNSNWTKIFKIKRNIVDFDENIDHSDDGPTQIVIYCHIVIIQNNIVDFDENIDDSYDGPTQSLQKEGISGADVKEQLSDSPFLS